MQQLAGVIVERLRRTWFGSVLALLWLALVTIVPTVRQCFGIAAKRGEVGGIVCSWGPALESLRQPGLALLLVFVGAIALVPLLVRDPSAILATGIASAVVVIGLVAFSSINPHFDLALSRLGLPIGSEADAGMLALLLASAAWIIASFRLRSRPIT
ncbi:MAG: hypothetical protein E6I88_07445 [Chloroflexi bacterium]|nr:MAG: hypothetical protein E6I88_07445 [Chloroflexota bacterium]TME47110.1 MAG: hypothetical protein E6I56_05125 [Chloroflexota bacterium]